MVLTIPALSAQIPFFYARSYTKSVSGLSADNDTERELNVTASLGRLS